MAKRPPWERKLHFIHANKTFKMLKFLTWSLLHVYKCMPIYYFIAKMNQPIGAT